MTSIGGSAPVAPRLALPGPVARAPVLRAVTCRPLYHEDPDGELDLLTLPGASLEWGRSFRLGKDMVLAVGPRLLPCPRLAGLVSACGHTPTSMVSDCGRCGASTRFAAGFGERFGSGDLRIATGRIEVEGP